MYQRGNYFHLAPLTSTQKEYCFGYAYERFGEEQNLKIRLVVASSGTPLIFTSHNFSETINQVYNVVESGGSYGDLVIDLSTKSDLRQRALTLHLMKQQLSSQGAISSLFVSVPVYAKCA